MVLLWLEENHGGGRGGYEAHYSPKRGRAAVPSGVPPTSTPRTPGTKLSDGNEAPRTKPVASTHRRGPVQDTRPLRSAEVPYHQPAAPA